MDQKILSLLLVLCAVVTNSKGNDENANSILVDSIDAFARNSSNIVFEKYKDENVIYSPTSVHILLAMLTYGSKHRTSHQLHDAICPLKKYAYCLNSEAFRKLLSNHQHAVNVTVNIANIMYLIKGIELNENYKQIISNVFLSEISTIKEKAEDTLNEANAWVDNKTNHKITKLFEKGDIDETTKMVLINAIYFNGEWEKPFKILKNNSFYTLNQTIIKIPMMTQLQVSGLHHGIDHDLKAQFIILPYKNPNYKMIFIVPYSDSKYTNRTVFENLGENLKNYNYSEFYEFGNKDKEFDLTIPKFMIKSDINLEPILREMNITDVFDENLADFSRMSKNPNDKFSINKIIQKATIVVNEKGSEASAATGSTSTLKMGGSSIIVNKPFYFAILSPHGTLFQGRILLPEYSY